MHGAETTSGVTSLSSFYFVVSIKNLCSLGKFKTILDIIIKLYINISHHQTKCTEQVAFVYFLGIILLCSLTVVVSIKQSCQLKMLSQKLIQIGSIIRGSVECKNTCWYTFEVTSFWSLQIVVSCLLLK